ncbi:low molecular weight phosphotyrosine protein phosphatase [Coraliomargarita sp. SDUM461004]|uniref:Low molecular weight phosphotyrosine protein phosphatase n=1 Tax=Thalassobacterium sedimentorum TaxID=3041258 RepID=A0ABU1AJS4_9BACT|nr:low molecular weight protein-tyrosine-phosphatase [Coraliomargarita sp. SDUM461004]MDQ8195060.1 low molecular weight phosphotyrosine protein phosphatase [Coraliomargarita sp. SDUM461004]
MFLRAYLGVLYLDSPLFSCSNALMHRILFLCMGNICRSPAGHCVMQHLVDEAGLTDGFEIESAGTIGFHAGSPPDHRMQQVMLERGIPVIGESQQLERADLAHYDLILAMDRENLAGARRLDRTGQYLDKIQLFCNYCTEHNVSEVPDPYYGGDRGFEHVMNIIEDGCRNLLKVLRAS